MEGRAEAKDTTANSCYCAVEVLEAAVVLDNAVQVEDIKLVLLCVGLSPEDTGQLTERIKEFCHEDTVPRMAVVTAVLLPPMTKDLSASLYRNSGKVRHALRKKIILSALRKFLEVRFATPFFIFFLFKMMPKHVLAVNN